MDPLHLALDVGHRARASRPNDRGTARGDAEEVALALAYTTACDAELRRLGHQVLYLLSGEYSARWQEAHDWGADLYVQAHVNAGGGSYGLACYDHRSALGAGVAAHVSAAMSKALPWITKPLAVRPDSNGVRNDEGENAFNCIRGCYDFRPVGLLIEPGFIDTREHLDLLLRDPARVGVALARGIDAWWRGR